ncbi:MAG: DUF1385 domain-containing protein [Dehalococcoidales bacterium]
MDDRFFYGGQAVIEGVMIRGKKAVTVAVRRPNGDVAVDTRPLPAFYTGRLRRVPLIRGIVVLVEALVLGIKSLLYSANVSLEEEEEKIGGTLIGVTMAVSMAAAVAVFFLIPMFVTRLFNIDDTFLFHLAEGLIRLTIFILYLWAISLMKDIRRVFAYHGAEHRVVNAHEAGAPLTTEGVRAYSTTHVRCGSSFLFIVLVIAILVFALVGLQSVWIMVLSRIVLVPVVAALGYEAVYFGARHTGNPVVRVLLKPGLLMQALSTRKPDDDQLEVALAAVNGAIEADRAEVEPAVVAADAADVADDADAAASRDTPSGDAHEASSGDEAPADDADA